jgi:predicted RNase H-like HicB family nuclease
MNYPVVIHKDENSDYGVTIPDIPGCFSAGSNIEEAIENSKEAILCHIEGLLMDNEDIPLPNSIEKHKDDPEYSDGTWALVDVDISKVKGKAKRINITIPERVLYKLDLYSQREGGTRSGLLVKAAMEYIASHNLNKEMVEQRT